LINFYGEMRKRATIGNAQKKKKAGTNFANTLQNRTNT
jgi:hypothetical protein